MENSVKKNPQDAHVSSIPSIGKKQTKFGRFFSQKTNKLLLATVVVPTCLSAVYFGLIASDVYVSESSFVVRSPRTQGSLSGLGALLQGAGFSKAQDDIYSVHEFMRSRDALQGISSIVPLKQEYSSANVDVLSRFNPLGMDGTFEGFYRYYLGMVAIELDSTTSISTLKTKAYTPETALKLNQNLLESAEVLINQLNDRARTDLVSFAEQQVNQARENVQEKADRLNDYRVKYGVYDLELQTKVQLQAISKLQDELIAIKTQYAQVMAVTPNNPQISSLIAREKSIRTEINSELSKLNGKGDSSFATKAAEFEKLTLESKLAETQFTSALTSFESAKIEMLKKQLYLEKISQPNKPDLALEPQRFKNILITFILGLIVYGVLKLLIASLREHQD